MKKIAIIIVGLVLAISTMLPASASSFRPHIKNSTQSLDVMVIYGGSSCQVDTTHLLFPGDSATSYGWDSFSSSDPFTVQVFSPTTGERLSGERIYPAGTCVKAYDNDYLVKVFEQ